MPQKNTGRIWPEKLADQHINAMTLELQHAVGVLQKAPWTATTAESGSIRVSLIEPSTEPLGRDGFSIRSLSHSELLICGETETGIANGIYDLLLQTTISQLASPFEKTWDRVEVPRWSDRRVSVATYVMGLTKMTPDMWTFPEWRRYIDFIRSYNINRLTILGLFPYHPDVPSSFKNKWKLDEQKKAIAYAHTVGIKVNVMTSYNMVPTEIFWEHPELRTDALPGYYGQALCWSKAKDTILEYQTYLLEYLDGVDGLEVMVTEPLGWCLCDDCRPHMASIWLDAVRELGSFLKKRNPNAEVVFWNWLTGYFPATKGKYPSTDKIENIDGIQEELLQGMPQGTIFTDLSMNQQVIDPDFPVEADDPRIIEILKVAPERGFAARSYFFYMDREFGVLDRANMFPKPFLDRTLDEIAYAKGLPVEGVCSYRLAPPARFLCDAYFMRLAWNPNLTRDQLLRETAATLTNDESDGSLVAQALDDLETYWNHRSTEHLVAAHDALDQVAARAPQADLIGIRDGIKILIMVDAYAQIVKDHEAAISACADSTALQARRQGKMLEIYRTLKEYPVYQGLTTDGVWEPRSVILLLRPRLDLWAAYLNRGKYD